MAASLSYAAYATEEFGPAKREIEKLITEKKYDEVEAKLNSLELKEKSKYGEDFFDDVELLNIGAELLNERIKWTLNENIEMDENTIQAIKDGSSLKAFDEGINDTKSKDFSDENAEGFFAYSLIQFYQTLLDSFMSVSDTDDYKGVLELEIRLAKAYSDIGDSQKSITISKNILSKVKKNFGEKSKETLTLIKILANNSKIMGKYNESKRYYQEAAKLSTEIYGSEARETFDNFNELIGIEFKLGNYKEGLRKIQDTFDQQKLNQADIFRYNAIASFYMGKYNETIDLLKKSSFIDHLADDILVDIMKSYRLTGDYFTSLKYHIALLSVNGMSRGISGTYNYKAINSMINLSDDYLALGMYDEALRMAQDSAKIAHETYGEEHPCTLEALTALTNAYRKLNRYEEAKELDQKLLEAKTKLFGKGSPEYLISTEALAYDYDGLKEYSKATKLHEEVWQKYKESFNAEHPKTLMAMKGLALNYLSLKKYDSVIKLYNDIGYLNIDKLKTMESPTESLEMTYILGEAYKYLGNNKEALFYYGKAINGYEKLRNSNTALTSEEKKQWLATLVPSYKNSASFFIDQRESGAAFTTAELCKARSLSEQYSEQLATYTSGLGNEEIDKINDYQNKLLMYKNEIEDAMKHNNSELRLSFEIAQAMCIENYSEYKKQLQEKYPKYKNTLNTTLLNRDVLNPVQLKQLLPDNSSFIDFTVLRKSDISNIQSNMILAFVVSKTGTVKGFNIPIEETFFDECKLYHDVIAYSNIESMRADNKYLWKLSDGSYKITNGRQSPAQNAAVVNSTKDLNNLRQILSETLGNKLLNPLKNYISTNSAWVISPDGELNNIPFETLQFNNKKVVESINVSYVPSLAVLKLMKEQETKNSSIKNRKGLFAMGDAIYNNNNVSESRGSLLDFSQGIRSTNNSFDVVDLTKIRWNNLPGTGKEIDKVSNVFQNKEVMRGKNASETNLKSLDDSGKLSQYKYLLFATHGLFIPQAPQFSSIVLSQGMDKNNDGYVTVGEWMGYNLNSDLVYLSACESGLGEYQAGEGIVGIPYALTIAGNKDTVMSLWKVNDEATAEFSSAFFKKLSKGKTEVQALNETKREFLANPNVKFNSPSVWAAFLLYGI